jgi:hypothetical protein
VTRSSARLVRRSCPARAPEDERASLRGPVPSLSTRQRLLVTHLLDLAKFLSDDARPGAGEAGPGPNGAADRAYRRSSGRRSDAMGLFRRALAMANACCLESVRRGLVGLRDEERDAGDHARAEAVNALLSEVDLRLSVFRDLRIGRTTD